MLIEGFLEDEWILKAYPRVRHSKVPVQISSKELILLIMYSIKIQTIKIKNVFVVNFFLVKTRSTIP